MSLRNVLLEFAEAELDQAGLAAFADDGFLRFQGVAGIARKSAHLFICSFDSCSLSS